VFRRFSLGVMSRMLTAAAMETLGRTGRRGRS
jgi:hypothetical protein